jgi:enoyl-CoA hydratase/carnithine racemase
LGLEASDNISSSELNHEYLSKMLEKVLQSEDAKEGIKAFKEKRKPKWN